MRAGDRKTGHPYWLNFKGDRKGGSEGCVVNVSFNSGG